MWHCICLSKINPSPPTSLPLSPSLSPPHSFSEVACPPHLSRSYNQASSGSSGFVFLGHLAWLQTVGTSSVQVRAGLVQTHSCHHSKGGSMASFWGPLMKRQVQNDGDANDYKIMCIWCTSHERVPYPFSHFVLQQCYGSSVSPILQTRKLRL